MVLPRRSRVCTLPHDEYDQAAEKKIIKKVEDLADQFQEIGPRFRVHVMDTQKKNYKELEWRLTKILRTIPCVEPKELSM